MRIKKFIARNLKEGKALILNELGEEAVILSSRTAKNPETGSEYIEIVAALDDSPNKKIKQQKIDEETNIGEYQPSRIKHEEKHSHQLSDRILDEIYRIQNQIFQMNENMKFKYSGALNSSLSDLYKLMRRNEYSDEFSLRIIGALAQSNLPPNAEYASEKVIDAILNKLKFELPLQSSDKQQIIFFTGTTGTGKTSALVKIAVVCKLLLKANIMIVSADNYKVAGAEQLQTIASIASIPFANVFSPDELASLIKDESRRDFIFVDTVGRSQNDKSQLEEIKSFIETANPNKVYLTINANSAPSSIIDTCEAFSGIGANSIVLTKLDELAMPGTTIESLSKLSLPIAYLSNGQRIPEDIEPADFAKMKDYVLRLKEGDRNA